MALYKSGQKQEARQIITAAVLSREWRASEATEQDVWIYHVLRREAQRLILPNLTQFLDGKYQPQDNDERLALVGECQFTNRSVAVARLFADAFTADPNLAKDLGQAYYWKAACAATPAGCGRGSDATNLSKPEKERLRSQSRQWLRAYLALFHETLVINPMGKRQCLTKSAQAATNPS